MSLLFSALDLPILTKQLKRGVVDGTPLAERIN